MAGKVIKVTLREEWYQKLMEVCERSGLRPAEFVRSTLVKNLLKGEVMKNGKKKGEMGKCRN